MFYGGGWSGGFLFKMNRGSKCGCTVRLNDEGVVLLGKVNVREQLDDSYCVLCWLNRNKV